MQVNRILSAVLSQAWLIDPIAAEGLLPIVVNMLKQGAPAQLGEEPEESESTKPYALAFVNGVSVDAKASTMMSYSSYDDAPAGSIAVTTVSGTMMRNDYCGSPGTNTLGQRIKEADAHPNIGAHLVRFNTPGGTVDGTEAFASIIGQTQKPLVAFAESMCSAGYWAGSGANLIVAAGKTAGVGSIGTMISLASFDKYYKEIGIEVHNIRATKSRDKNQGYYEAMEGKYEKLRTESLDPINEAFLSSVQENREGKLNLKKEDVLTGKVYYGQSIVDVGLADEIGNFDYAVRRAQELAQDHSSSNQTSIHNQEMSIFSKNKFPKLSALAGKKSEEITAEDIQAVNEELTAAGIENAGVISAAQLTAFEAAEKDVTRLTAENKTLTTANTKLTTDLEAANKEVTRLGALDGATPTGTPKAGNEMGEESADDENQKLIDALPHNQALAGNPLFN
ncbi:S49 family peptidase [Adhaeribacter swui]|uniref:S49 family peptidase n=1 Tax=Adhaeribacter swui TaxID=2086471 RepID=A0A7G7GB17_9BACT|nr:S49 family peptidase [Adhaeribacter swui]QNF34351.1 S49 family peptidase [Adhaeribacter swui]